MSATVHGAPTLRRLHPSSLLFHAFGFARQFVFPLLVLALQLRRGRGPWVWWALGALVVLFAVGAIARFLTTRFGLTADAMHVRSGVFSRQARVIPFGRIQSVNVRQSPLQRLLGMSELRVETATQGTDAEVELAVLPWREAQALREELVAARRRALAVVAEPTASASATSASATSASATSASATSASATSVSAATATIASARSPVETERQAEPPAPEPRVVAAVDTERLMLAGATSNNVMALLALLVGGFERLRSTFFDDLDVTDGVIGVVGSVQGALGGSVSLLLFVLLVLMPLLVASWMVSVGGSVVRWHGFTLEQVGRDLRRRYGLLSRAETSVPVARAQALRYHESILRRPFGLGELYLVSAGAAVGRRPDDGGSHVLLPILRRAELRAYVPAVFPDASIGDVLDRPLREAPWRRPMRGAVLRVAASESVVIVLLLAVLAVWRPHYVPVTAWLLPLAWLIAWLQVRARAVAVTDGHVIVRRGGIGRSTMILPEAKLQLIEVRQGPLQRRIGSATLRLTTAGVGGDADVEDLPLDEARALQEDLQARLARTARRTVRPVHS